MDWRAWLGRDLVGGLVGIGWLLLLLFLFCLVVRGSLILIVRKRGEFPQITAGVLALGIVVMAVILVPRSVLILWIVRFCLVVRGALILLVRKRGEFP